MVGLTPLASLHNLLVLVCVLVLRANLSAFLVAFGLFSGIAYALDPLFHRIGLALLTAPALQGPWTALYDTAIGRLSAFNNSVVMGSLVVCSVCFVPGMLVSNRLIVRYRETVVAWVKRTRLVRVLQASRLYQAYARASSLTGGT